jgi:acetoin utilization deacetylase AcuC-like enzyme
MAEHDRRSTSPGESLFASSARRLWNQIVVRLHRLQIEFAYSTDYQVDLGTAPLDSLRAQKIVTYLLSQAMITPRAIVRPELVSLRDLELAHSRDYLESLREPSSLDDIAGLEVWPDLHEQVLLAQRSAVAGSILETTKALKNRSIGVNLGGGFHHATYSSGRGFCVFNDVAVAILKARQSGFSEPILVVDLDLHDGNGTREIFADDDTVFTFSIHNLNWSSEPAKASMSIELTGEIDDTTYLDALRSLLPGLLEEVQPGLVYYLAGTDPAFDDAVGNWKISAQGMLNRDRYVMSQIADSRAHATPTVVLLAGGYGSDSWRYSARFFAWLLTNSTRREPPSTEEMTLARYRSLAGWLDSDAIGGESRAEDWGLTESDITGGLGPDGGQTLFLGHYSHHALELALEWTGLFDRLRSLGFYHPFLDLDLTNPNGHTLRLFTDSRKHEILIECRLRIERHFAPDASLLSIEWLLMQNPRTQFTPGRQRLPQQKHPGLGLLSDFISVLILICDRMKLDGIVFVPSHFHLVLSARPHLLFLRSDDKAWFEAVERAVRGLPVVEATGIVSETGLQDRSTGKRVAWRPMPMVLPVSKAFRERVEEEQDKAAAGLPESDFDFEIAAESSS